MQKTISTISVNTHSQISVVGGHYKGNFLITNHTFPNKQLSVLSCLIISKQQTSCVYKVLLANTGIHVNIHTFDCLKEQLAYTSLPELIHVHINTSSQHFKLQLPFLEKVCPLCTCIVTVMCEKVQANHQLCIFLLFQSLSFGD